ncbi:MAG: L-threonylcarbamoyladenylate synthase [Rickettsiales bacterium]|jgi:L-threonylcarbamoyladenylate synthase
MQNNTLDDELADRIELASALLHAGKLVAFPTETVYGLGANALSDSAVAAIYAAKGRPTFNPLIVHVSSIDEAKKYVQWNDDAQILAEIFWPGSLTLVLPRKQNCKLSLLVSAGLDCVAIRIPAHPIALALLKKSALPLAAPSANISGRISPTLALHVSEELGDKVAMVLDGGACSVGIESTILNLSDEVASILRHGKITREDLEKYIKIGEYNSELIKSAGMLKSHYAPNAKVRLNAIDVADGEILLAFGKPILDVELYENLSVNENLEEAAANLFRMLRCLDAKNPKVIAVMPIPEVGLGVAINDRLHRAAAPRG